MPMYHHFDYPEMLSFIKKIPDYRIQTFARIGYLLGGRITELLSLTSKQVRIKDDLIIATIRTLKTRRGEYIYRDLPNVINDEKYYSQALVDFQQTTPTTTLQEYVELGGVRNIELKFIKTLGQVPHSLRHVRATHMGHAWIPSKIHQPTAAYLKYYFGWANIATANEYIDNLTIQDILIRYDSSKVTPPGADPPGTNLNSGIV